jgi:SAM-dependent methyltransferase
VSDTSYIHGTAPEEQARLSLMNDLINAESLRALALRPGERVLDLGSGLGQLSRAMARATGARVVGVEASERQLEEARRLADAAGEPPLCDFRQGDVLAPPLAPGEWGAFDVVHARFLLEHLVDPAAAVAVMARAVRPGGRVVLSDDDHELLTLHPEPPGFARVWRAYIRSFDRNRNDPLIGRRLVALLHGAGLEPRRMRWLAFGGCAGEAAFAALVENLAGVIATAREPMLELGLTAAELDALRRELDAFARRPDGYFGYAMPCAEGVRKAG